MQTLPASLSFIDRPTPLLGGLSPARFMRQHWQKKPLLVRQAIPNFKAPVSRADLFAAAAREEAPSRLIVSSRQGRRVSWEVLQGPFARRAFPPLKQAGWTLLVQGMDRQSLALHQVLQRFAFVPAARLDDLMVSYASPGGGVGPHFDSYDVFLLQAHGRREWRIAQQTDLRLRDDLPLKVLKRFEPEQTWVLEPGDMLYLPPHWAHDGVALDECMTYSIGFRSPSRGELVRELLLRLADDASLSGSLPLPNEHYADPRQVATSTPAEIPADLAKVATDWVQAALHEPRLIQKALGEYLSEPPDAVWFEASGGMTEQVGSGSVRLHVSTRALYDVNHLFMNGDSFAWAGLGGSDQAGLQRLSDSRQLSGKELRKLSPKAKSLLRTWLEAGWVCVGGADES